jgi:heme exporter protein A
LDSQRINGGLRLRLGAVAILRLERVGKRYGRRLVFADADLLLRAGEFVLLVGANGAGKTTLLRLLAGIARPTVGRVRWEGPEAPPSAEAARAVTGFVAHQPLLYDELTAHENLAFALRMHERDDVDQGTDATLKRFGLEPRAHDRVGTFSRGLKQRLALARAFALEPRLLLLDEPASGLDASGADLLLKELETAKGVSTIVVATHEPDPFRPLADRTVEVRDGRLHDWGRPG